MMRMLHLLTLTNKPATSVFRKTSKARSELERVEKRKLTREREREMFKTKNGVKAIVEK